MQELYKSIGRIAPQDVTVLILGESGTGKELVARAIYQHSRRSQAPFLAINCAAIPESLLESELFGHERGAFTGADRRRIGKFEQAHGGTVFMDEVGDMAPGTQAKLLRLLQEKQFERVGGNTTIHSDIRIIAATNQDLESLAAAGRFRQDLFYRLNVLTIRIPPLRERIEDIPLLLEYFLVRMNRELDRHVRSVSPEAMQLLTQHSWPGNVRELQSAVKYALVHTAGDTLTARLPPSPSSGEVCPQLKCWPPKSPSISPSPDWCKRLWPRNAETSTTRFKRPWIGSCSAKCWNTSRETRWKRPISWAFPGPPCGPNSAPWAWSSRSRSTIL